ncbi:MAG: alpha/beta fold hydrolase [Geminicoccaceae bacterium]
MDLVVDNQNVFAFTNGREFDPEKPTIIFVHGAGMNHSVWTLQARYFAHHGANAVAIDLPGHGRSDGPPKPSIEAMGDWVGALIDALGVKQATLVGHSMGALICLQAAAAHPTNVEHLALLGISPEMPVHPALLEAAAAGQPLASELVSSWGHGPAGHVGGNRAPGGWLMGSAIKLLSKAPKGVLHNDLAACDAYRNGMAAAQAIRCPTLILCGTQDRMTPARQGAKLAQAMANTKLVEIDGSGHLMLVEKPDETLDALIAALG